MAQKDLKSSSLAEAGLVLRQVNHMVETQNGLAGGETQDDQAHLHVKSNRIKFVTKLLIDNKYGLMDDLNYTRGLPESYNSAAVTEDKLNHGESNKIQELKQPTVIPIPRSTRIKAERVRIYLDYYYSIMDRYVNLESRDHHHSGVEGVYNPLQVIRNRKLRKKYHEMPPRELFAQKAPVIAIRQFSSKPNKKMPWFVDVSERSSDLTWRTSHWDELLDPNGDLWFKSSKNAASSPTKEVHRHHRPHIRRRTSSHLELPNSSPYQISSVNPSSPELRSRHMGSISDASVSTYSELPTTRLEVSGPASSLDENERSRLNRFEMIIGKRPKRWSRSPHLRRRSHGSVEKLPLPMSKGEPYGDGTSAHSRASSASGINLVGSSYMTPVESQGPRTTLLSALPIRSVRKHSQDKDGVHVEHLETRAATVQDQEDEDSLDPLDPLNKTVQTDKQLEKFWADTRYMSVTMRMMEHRRITHSIVKERGIQRRSKVQCDDDMKNVLVSTSNILKTYDRELDKAFRRGNLLASRILNNYSMRVETLISTTDRILSDINTSLTLKLKTFQEDVDKFGNLKMMRAQKLTKFFYRILEFIIVIALWSIWLVVSIVKWIKYLTILSFKAVIWMIW